MHEAYKLIELATLSVVQNDLEQFHLFFIERSTREELGIFI